MDLAGNRGPSGITRPDSGKAAIPSTTKGNSLHDQGRSPMCRAHGFTLPMVGAHAVG